MVTHDELCAFFAGKRVAFVGNAPTVLRERNGPRIDDCDVVVRCNAFNVGEEFAPHVGTRTDVVAFSFALFNGYRPAALVEKLGVRYVVATVPSPEEPTDTICRYYPGDVLRNFANYRRQGFERHRERTYWLSTAFVEGLGDYVGRRPTTGLSIVAWMLEYAPFSELFLTGLSFDNAVNTHYNDADYGFTQMDFSNHDSRREGLACRALVRLSGKRVVLDAHLQEIFARIDAGEGPRELVVPKPFEVLEAQVAYGRLGLDGQLGYDGRTVSVEGQRHLRALSAHAPSRVLLQAPPGLLLELEGTLNDTAPAGSHTPVRFTIHSHDGRILRDLGQAIRGRATTLARVRVPEDGLLELRAATEKKAYSHAVWLWNAPEWEG